MAFLVRWKKFSSPHLWWDPTSDLGRRAYLCNSCKTSDVDLVFVWNGLWTPVFLFIPLKWFWRHVSGNKIQGHFVPPWQLCQCVFHLPTRYQSQSNMNGFEIRNICHLNINILFINMLNFLTKYELVWKNFTHFWLPVAVVLHTRPTFHKLTKRILNCGSKGNSAAILFLFGRKTKKSQS